MSEEQDRTVMHAKLLQRLSRRYYEAYKRGDCGDRNVTVETSLMRMMAVMGELSALAFTATSSISPFEKEEVSRLVGKLSISVAAIAEAFELNVAKSALQYIEEELQAAAASHQREAEETQESKAAAGPAAPTAPLNAPAPAAARDAPSVVLSPTSNERFFRFVDQLATAPRESFQEANLKWVAPAPDGALEELIPNGRAITVAYDDFPHYRARLAQYREARSRPAPQSPPRPRSSPSPSASMAPLGNGPAVASISSAMPAVVAQAPGYDPVRESDLYSPSHFSGGLFSPMARVPDTGMLNVYAPAAVVESEAASGSAADARRRQCVQQMGRPYEVSDFNQKVNLLRSGIVQGADIAKLGLTFSVVDGTRVVELVNDGLQVSVTAANAKAFLDLLEHYSSTQTLPPARVHRSNSVRKIDVHSSIPDVPATFSPSHFSHDLFAPFTKPTSAVYIDYDKTSQMLPPFLKEHGNGVARDTRNLYLNAARCSDCTTLERIVREVKASPAAVEKYGVTFCVPSSLEPYSTAEELHSGLHALFPSSALQPVLPSQQPQFLSLVRQYFPHIL